MAGGSFPSPSLSQPGLSSAERGKDGALFSLGQLPHLLVCPPTPFPVKRQKWEAPGLAFVF